MANRRPLGGYQCAIGSKALSVFPHIGPTSYTQVTATAGTVPATGGDTVQAGPEAGVKAFDTVFGGVTDDGAFYVEAIPITVSNPNAVNSSALSGIPSTTFLLRWMARVTASVGGQNQVAGTEAIAASNLSGECVRLTAIGISL